MKQLMLLCFGFLLLVHVKIYSQDTSLRISNLCFNSDFERKAFEEFDSTDFKKLINLAMACNSDKPADADRAYESLINFTKVFMSPDFAILKPEKKIKQITKGAHTRYFKKYSTESYFSDVFARGDYNCVTGSIVYALVLKAISIQFEGRLNPTHVFLVAYPKSTPILVEATDPNKGYIIYNNDFKNQFVEYLKSNKIIDLGEYERSSKDELFQRYYFEQSVMSLKNIIGVQYYNIGLSQLSDRKFQDAFHSFMKAAYLFPEYKNFYHALVSGTSMMVSANYQDSKVIDDFINLLTIRNYGITDSEIEGEFSRITFDLLNTKGLTEKYDSVFNRIYSSLPEGELKQNICFSYNFSRARNLALRARYSEAFEYSAKAYQLQLNNAEAEALFLSIIQQTENNFASDEDFIDRFKIIITEFPSLLANREVKMLQLALYLYDAKKALATKSDSQVLNNFRAFEENIGDFKLEYPFTKFVEDTYYSTVVYFYKKGKKSEAYSLHAKAEKLLPNSFEIQRLKKAIM